MLKDNSQLKLSEYRSLYDIIVPKDNLLRKIKENIDFSFVNPMLKESYCEHFGRPAKEPEMMFKFMFLKKIDDLSDEELIRSTKVNMAYKYFLDLDPEDEVIHSSLLTKFRKLHITVDILEEMLAETVRQAVEKGIIKSHAIIVDSTHTKSSAKHETPTQILRRYTKELRKEIYRTQYELSNNFPEKPEITSDLNEEIAYSRKLIDSIKQMVDVSGSDKSRKMVRRVENLLKDDKIKDIQSAVDKDAKLGYKSEENSFFGYKTHIAMTDERIISAIEVTTGEAPDGRELVNLIKKSKANGVKVSEVLGDTAYSSKENLDYSEEQDIALVSKLNPIISNGSGRQKEGFTYNKDADMYVCPAGNLASHKTKDKSKGNKNDRISYYFDIEKCKQCPKKDGCYKNGAKSKTYKVRILSETHQKQKVFQESDYFKQRAKERYKIEAKNAELKQSHGLREADSVGVFAMQIQSYFTAFVANVKRIVKLETIKMA
ncbi:MAG: IS1182 family transposase [Bacteroidales bacterium]|jgi:IS5 family transposase|nr:IS1182 family transposase [Bacteroidales bacterium]